VLNVEAKQALLKLVRSGRLAREQVAGRYVYLSTQAAPRRAQLAARSVYDAEASAFPSARACGCCLTSSSGHRAFLQPLGRTPAAALRRAGAMKVGHGGDAQVAELLDIDPGTVARGRQELLAGDITPGRVRRPGGGRPSAKKRPEVIEAIGRLMEHDTAGDPVSGVKWTRRTTEKIAAELGTAGIVVCPTPSPSS